MADDDSTTLKRAKNSKHKKKRQRDNDEDRKAKKKHKKEKKKLKNESIDDGDDTSVTAKKAKKAAKKAKKEKKRKQKELDEKIVAAELLLLLKKPQKPKGKKTYRKRRRTEKNDVEKASTVFQDRIRKINDFSEVINLFGECIFYESLFIWQKLSTDRFKNQRCSNSFGLIGDIMLVLEKNYKALFKLFMELPSMQSSKHYPVVVRSEDVSNQALQRASKLVLDLLTTRDFTCIKDISPYCAKQIKVYHIPIELIMIPIEETFISCLHIVP